MRLLMVSPSAVLGGAEVLYTDLARLLPEHGVEPHLLLLADGPLVGRLREQGLRADVVDAGRLRDPRAFAAATRAVAQRMRGADVVLSNLPKAHLYAALPARRLGVPAVWWQAGIPSPANWLDRLASRLPAAAVLANSEAAAAAQRRLGGPPVHVVHPGTDVSRFRPGLAPSLGKVPGEVLVGIVGRLEEWKGQEAFLRAARLVLDRAPYCRFAVVGGALLGWEGDYPDRLRALAHRLGIADRVAFTGHRDDMPAVYASLDVVVNASDAEPFGLVVTEAMACGLPVVAYRAGGPAEVVVDGGTGLLCQPGSVPALADAIVTFAVNAGTRERMGRAGRKRVEQDFSDRIAAGRVAEVLGRVTSAPRSRRSRPTRSGAAIPRSVLLLGMEWQPDVPGGLNRYVHDLYRALDGRVSRRAVVVGPVTRPEPGVVPAGDMADPLPLRLFRYARTARRLARSADVVDAHFALYAWPVVVRRRRTPLVVHFHGPWAAEARANVGAGGLDARLRAAVERAVYRRADTVVVLSQAFADVVVRDYGVPRSRVAVVPPGVDLDRFTAGTGGRVPVVFAARRLVPRMGLDVLLRAWADPRFAGHVLEIAGEGELRDELEALARELGIADRVRLLGRISEEALVDRYRTATVSVVPTAALEGFGLIVLESLACGTPVVVTGAGGLPEAVAGLDPSLVVPPGDAAALADRLASALAGDVPDAAACRAYAERFSWSAAADRHLELYARRRLRVVYLDHTAVPSGAEIALAELIRALPDVDAHVILGADGPAASLLRGAGATVEVLPYAATALRRDRATVAKAGAAGLTSTAAYTARLTRRLRALRPDVVHANSLKAAVYGGPAARAAGVPFVWHARDFVGEEYLPAAAVKLVRTLARTLPTAVVANSAATLASLRVAGHVVPSPVPPVRVERLQRNGFTVGSVARLSPWKGQHVFLEAFAKAFGDDPSVRARVVGGALFGEDGYAASLRTLAATLGIAERVTFTGHVDDVAAELAQLDVLVHSAVTPEPFGQVVVQGMSAGLAVVAAAAGGPAETVTDGVDGLLVRPGDVAAYADALLRLRDDPALRTRLGAAAQQTATAYAPDVVAEQLRAIYDGLR